jgi:uncharacterized iron-regulated protein
MRLLRRSLLVAPSLLLAACAASRSSDPSPRPDASGWVSPRNREHPLAGKIWNPRTGAFVDQAVLDAAVAGAHHLLLGETHDNADHHLLQARLVRLRAAAGRPALVLEKIDTNRQEQLDGALRRPAVTAPDVAAAVAWDETGWPRFAIYRPLVEAALAARLPIVAGNLPRTTARALMKEGPSALPEPVRERIDRVGAFPDDVLEALRRQMSDAHCGEFPASVVGPMVLAQKAKDAQLAERMASADRGDGTILVAGSGHVRTDVGVPRFLSSDAAAKPTVSVAITEVSAGRASPDDYREDYGAGPLPFDFVVFTPGAERADPCAELREREAKKRAEPPATAAPPPGGAAL